MTTSFNYTANAQRFFARFPRLTFIMIQATFWVFANILLAVIVYLQSKSVSTEPLQVRPGTAIFVAAILGVLYATILGLCDLYFDRKLYPRLPLWKIIFLKTLVALIVLIFCLVIIRFIFLDTITSSSFYNNYFTILVIYYFFMSLVISFINQMNKRYGHGVLVPLLLGRYRKPHEEERIFMFMDLRSSTTHAEQLGHLKYSAFIRDCFMDINQVLLQHRAEVYQYVGDEIVLTWRSGDGLKDQLCIHFYFACMQQLEKRASYYQESYGVLPHFKAGVHVGKVTVVEIGDIKRDIAYHGDAINTAARIQSVCNMYDINLLVSEELLGAIKDLNQFEINYLGKIDLKGKTQQIGIAGINIR